MIVAGIGCRKGCPAEAIVALVRAAGGADMLATPWFKQSEPGLQEAASLLGVALRYIPPTELGFPMPPVSEDQRSTMLITRRLTEGWPAVAEGCALAGGGTLVRSRINNAMATCVLAFHPDPPP